MSKLVIVADSSDEYPVRALAKDGMICLTMTEESSKCVLAALRSCLYEDDSCRDVRLVHKALHYCLESLSEV